MNLPREKVAGPIAERRRPVSRRNSRHEIRMSYGFHSSERINRADGRKFQFTTDLDHTLSLSLSRLRARGPRAFRLLEARTGYRRRRVIYGLVMSLATLRMIFLRTRCVSRGLMRALPTWTRLPPG